MEIVVVVAAHFDISDFKNKFSVPFIVTNSDISKPVVGFNIIEHLVKENISEHFSVILKLFLSINKSKTELVANLIKENSRASDVNATVKSAENIKISGNSFSLIKYKFKTSVFDNRILPVIFQENFNLIADLVATENFVKINPSKSKTIKIPIFNPTSKDIFIRNNQPIANLELIATSKPLEIKPIEIPVEVSKIEIQAPNNQE